MSSSSASLFPQRETRNTSDTLVTGDEAQGTMGWMKISRPFSSSRLPLRANFFWPFLSSSFYTLERRFFFREYRETFSWPIVPKKKTWKN